MTDHSITTAIGEFKGAKVYNNKEVEYMELSESDEEIIFRRMKKLTGFIRMSPLAFGISLKLKYFIDHNKLKDRLSSMYPECIFEIKREDGHEVKKSLYDICIRSNENLTNIDLT